MELLIHQLLSKEESKKITSNITKDNSCWIDGKTSAGSYAAKVKNNLQLKKDSEVGVTNSNKVNNKLTSDQLIKSFALPRKVHGTMFTRSSVGQGYGMHVDNAYMSSGRSDLSFTIFLSSPNEYQGGELLIQSMQGVKEIKLNCGQIVIYPSTSLHSVKQVSQGERIVCVGWIQSYVANNEDRNFLFGLDAGARGLLAKHGRSDELDLVFQAYSNLLRRLGD
ncbi:Fe2+-dependent dioxygenase [Prochlorococcus marinus]|uniref:PKHD-type hydroxylase P9211_12561 n=1 Tax=Prochlorococcus marinus (strain MIT 9211) TaxID=93059 RepID=Y1256_PROM4|nr:Fe2+-dependent dioxygenase [Prochlorococcus marinus]A9BBH5.1 RecName: Full=PKHD-type hydroxylase P9211_12561 [Prochlorococcus marinus str. MIT 9211]ABX09187.1 Hypothetical protein P9211_12561 [Prochlorococcus marinus str. MIT 9211]